MSIGVASRRDFVVADFDCVYLGAFRCKGDAELFSIDRVAHRIMPYTPEMRERAFRMRGRGGFSYGKAVCVLPSAHFYARRVVDDNLEEVNEDCLETERDEED